MNVLGMNEQFEVAAGSIAGRDHVLVGKNNQDAYYHCCTEAGTIAIVSDGCGSGHHSEVGAKIGAQWVGTAIESAIQHAPQEAEWLSSPQFWQQIQRSVLEQLQTLAKAMGNGFSPTIADYFLFTIVGAIVTPEVTVVFSLGDGVAIVNGQVTTIAPLAGNQPPYLSYALTGSSLLTADPDCLQFHMQQSLPTEQVESILIGTDGVSDLIHAADRTLPGKPEPVGAISQFWRDDRYFKNPDMIRRRLALINRDVTQPDWARQTLRKEAGLLPDDTTLVVIRRIN